MGTQYEYASDVSAASDLLPQPLAPSRVKQIANDTAKFDFSFVVLVLLLL